MPRAECWFRVLSDTSQETLEKMSEEIDEDAPPKQQNEEEDVDFQNAEDFGENEDFGLRRREEETPIRHPVRDVVCPYRLFPNIYMSVVPSQRKRRGSFSQD